MTKRVLLVSPPRNYPMKNEMYPSGALLALGTLLESRGHKVKVIHSVVDKVNETNFYVTVEEYKPDIVGFTMSTYQTRHIRLMAREVKFVGKNIMTIAGGPHPSALKAQLLSDFPDIDIVAYGEGEESLVDIAEGKPLSDIKGICYRQGNEVITNRSSPMIPDLDALPLVDTSLVDYGKFSGLYPVGRRPCMFVMSSRGCPYQCTFCSRSVYGSTLRMRSPTNIMAEVEKLHRDWGIKEIHFGDDTFNANRQWADELLGLIIKAGYNKKMAFRVALRVNERILDLDLLKHLKEAGVWFVYYGVENGNQAMLDGMRKGITVEEVRRAFKLTHGVGIKTEAFFIIGMPGETVKTIQDSYNFYKELKPYWCGFSRAMPLPGTKFTEQVMESGHLLSVDYDGYGPGSMVVRTEELTAGQLNAWINKMDNITRRDKLKKPKQVAYALSDKIGRRI